MTAGVSAVGCIGLFGCVAGALHACRRPPSSELRAYRHAPRKVTRSAAPRGGEGRLTETGPPAVDTRESPAGVLSTRAAERPASPAAPNDYRRMTSVVSAVGCMPLLCRPCI